MTDTPLIEQVEQARAAFDAAHHSAESAAAGYAEGKRRVGSNESERKERKSNTPPDDYALYVAELPALENTYKAAAAHLERCEADWKTKRELLRDETARVELETARIVDSAIRHRAEVAEFERITAQLLSATADVQARRAGTRITMQEIRHSAAGNCPDCGKSMALDIHDDCVPF